MVAVKHLFISSHSSKDSILLTVCKSKMYLEKVTFKQMFCYKCKSDTLEVKLESVYKCLGFIIDLNI